MKMEKDLLFLVIILCLSLELVPKCKAQTFEAKLKIKRCPNKLLGAKMTCAKEKPENVCTCYLFYVFEGDNVDLTFATNILYTTEFDVSIQNLLEAFVIDANNAMVMCVRLYLEIITPRLDKYKYCIYDILDKICESDGISIFGAKCQMPPD